jgi:hypothetical protein
MSFRTGCWLGFEYGIDVMVKGNIVVSGNVFLVFAVNSVTVAALNPVFLLSHWMVLKDEAPGWKITWPSYPI